MNFIVICLHCLDMRDFHSNLRDTPFLDSLRARSIFIPMGRGQGHHQLDSLNAEMTGVWTARFCKSILTKLGYQSFNQFWLPKTVLEYLAEQGYELLTCMAFDGSRSLGSMAVSDGMSNLWLKNEPERLKQFSQPGPMGISDWVDRIKQSRRFYAHIFLRETHRAWGQEKELYALMGLRSRLRWWYRRALGLPTYWPHDAEIARRAALEKPDAFAALRRRGLAKADRIIASIFEATRELPDVTYIVYSNHGEVFDHFRYNQQYVSSRMGGLNMVECTSHGPFPYEVLYANMQMWLIPGRPPAVMTGIGRSIDFAPTVLELAGITPTGMDGQSMLGQFSAGGFPDRDRYAEVPTRDGCLSMVRSDGFKFIALGTMIDADKTLRPSRGFPGHRLAVFDLRADPFEFVNLIDTPRGQEVVDWAIRRHRELIQSGSHR